jgi:predicted methyltransferase
MIRPTTKTLTATLFITAAASLMSFAGEAPQQQAPAVAGAAPQQQAPPQVDAPPPKPYAVPAKAKDFIKKAVELPSRPAWVTVHDAYRKPAELLTFANIRPGQRVVEFSAYGNYWSTMLADIVGPKGELYMYDHLFAAPLAEQSKAFVAANPNTKFQNLDFNTIEFPKGIDLVWCVACFHEILGTGVNIDPFFAKLYKAMKPGAKMLVVFYTARDGMENRDVGALHRIDPGTVRGTFQAAGFQLQEENRLLQNPQDDKKTPVFTEKEGDLADRMVYRFIKP